MSRLAILMGLAAAVASAASQPIFDGRSLKGWMPEGPSPSFVVESGDLVVTGTGNQPNWLHTAAEYENFRLHFEYNLAQWGEAAVVLRGPRLGRPMQAGLSLYLAHDYHKDIPLRATGSIPGVRGPQHALPPSFSEWHAVDLSLEGDHFRATIDAAVVQDVDLSADPELRHRLKRGFIGFPDLGYKYRLRNLRLEDLGSPTKFDTPLGPTLDGWELRGSGEWQVRDGILTAWGGDGVLYAPGEYRNFELTLLVRSHLRVNSGVFLHGSPDPKQSRGFEIQIYSPIDSVYPTGSIYNFVRSNPTADFEGRWFLMQIEVNGPRCQVRLDGTLAAESPTLPEGAPPTGRIGLQFHSPGSPWVEFRDIRIRPL